MNTLQRKRLVKGILKQDKILLQKLYSENFSTIKRFVIENNGSEEDAQDVFQEAIIITYRKAKSGTFQLTSSFKSYIYSVCRFIWIKQLSKKQEENINVGLYNEYESIEDIEIDEYVVNEQYKLYQTHYKRLSHKCQEIIRLSLKKVSFKNIAKIMNMESEKYTKQKKYRCKEQLVKYIKSDPKFAEL
ncbi:MAG: sigma-70 family RNA polymerase sigma factor [Bacteroidales bacterium]|nr:sigma-70 family RNA polymerase sigma factor [Bacteroidales bacterium]